ncbi:DNA polymerase IV [Candidatus Micrarchaeota archaeon]|nr:DNA polymerase IV [Candidatus Micrarchaeota archaeon]
MYLHVDMDYFYAQVEEKRRPMAKGKIVVVCMYSGRTPDSGAVATVNYLGREIGIKAGMPIMLAKKRAPPADSIFVPADREYYALISAQIDEIIRKIFKRVVQSSIDEWNIEDETAENAPKIKEIIKKELDLTCTVGVAPSPLGAKMAASKAKPDGLLILNDQTEKKLIEDSDLEKVPGIGPKTAEALREFGVNKVGELKNVDPMALVETFGKKSGGWLHSLATGNYPKELGEEKEQEEVSRYGTLKEKTRDMNMMINKIDELEKDAREWIMHMKKSFRTFTIMFITEDMKVHSKSMSFKNPMPWNADTNEEEKALIAEFLQENHLYIRRIGIRFGNFMDLSGQTTLF